MPPSGLAILIGAGPTSGVGICRILAHPSHGNLAVAILARNADNLNALATGLRLSTPNPVEAFPTDASPEKLSKAFSDIRSHSSFKDLKLKVAVFHVKHASKKPFLEETHSEFTESLNTYVGGAMAFSKEVVNMLFDQNGQTLLADGGGKKGTLIFTGTLGAMRTNANFAAYGASRSGVRSLAQALAKEYSPRHKVPRQIGGILSNRYISNEVQDGIKDEDGEAQQQGKVMKAESVG
ncbi:hypothetical protein IMSHALPRED_007084 [Imshaugia aleurites]|uniref:Uncharacterized protein n=1 Tax=Imshaugia aleurites TaxID=172621 RepID=A0A8H3FJ60_9LECA|nr:hypothetical protein IMSHALPRED_007084 [Imshaugia aleurites]